jgi:peptidoglycan/xylan/chitin deacetylase (PgdA/CDA1 family)
MPDPRSGTPDRIQERRAEAARLRAVRRRRILFGGLAAAIAVAIAVAVVLVGGSGSSSGGGGSQKSAASVQAKPSGTGKPARSEAGWRPHPGPVPILMYHVIDRPPADAPYPDLFVDPNVFEAQVRWLASHGYAGVTLDDVERAWYSGGKLPPKPIVLSFDDGYLGQYTHALPDLRRLGWPGVLDLKAEGSDLSDREVGKMIAAGWELASHTISHLDLTTLDPSRMREEVAGSRAQLRKRFGVAVDNFCYPAGRYDDAVIAAVKEAGYRGATTTDPGLAGRGDPYTLKRIRVDRSDGVGGLAEKLGTGG